VTVEPQGWAAREVAIDEVKASVERYHAEILQTNLSDSRLQAFRPAAR
jgi:hypothetical protein